MIQFSSGSIIENSDVDDVIRDMFEKRADRNRPDTICTVKLRIKVQNQTSVKFIEKTNRDIYSNNYKVEE